MMIVSPDPNYVFSETFLYQEGLTPPVINDLPSLVICTECHRYSTRWFIEDLQWTGHLTSLSLSLTTSTLSPTTIEYALFSVSLDAYTTFGKIGDLSSHVAEGGAGESEIFFNEEPDDW